jgi:uncharacterized protein YkwD
MNMRRPATSASDRRHPWRAGVVAAMAATLLSIAGGARVADARPAVPATTPAATAGAFVQEINAVRAARGLGALAVSDQLATAATSWTKQMASAGTISHNADLGAGIDGWRLLGENVGMGNDVAGIMDGFVASPTHLANLMEPRYTHVGVGVVQAPDGTVYTTHNFMTATATTAAATQTAPLDPAPVPGPRSTATPAPTTAAAPTTTVASPAASAAQPAPQSRGTADRVALVLEPLRALEAR